MLQDLTFSHREKKIAIHSLCCSQYYGGCWRRAVACDCFDYSSVLCKCVKCVCMRSQVFCESLLSCLFSLLQNTQRGIRVRVSYFVIVQSVVSKPWLLLVVCRRKRRGSRINLIIILRSCYNSKWWQYRQYYCERLSDFWGPEWV